MVYKLHGSLPQKTRTAIVRDFSSTNSSNSPSLLLATDVASRGLDLPNLDLVIEYDPAFSSDDHLHRIGRTARLGREGRAVSFLLPGAEESYVDVLRSAYQSDSASGNASVTHTPCNDILRKGFTPVGTIQSTSPASANWEARATNFQLSIEQWVLSSPRTSEMARRAFQSHIRAYATHIVAERGYFDIKTLHLGHMAKAFGLREAPAGMMAGRRNGRGKGEGSRRKAGGSRDGDGDHGAERGSGKALKAGASDEAVQKMRAKMRDIGKLGGASAASEFNIA